MNTLEEIEFKLTNLFFSKTVRQYYTDVLIGVGLAIAIAISTYFGTYQIPDPVFIDFYAQDVWFGSDIPTVFGNITSFKSDFGRNNKHPLFPLLIFPLVYGLSKFFSLDPLTAVRVVVIFVSALWVGSLYCLFRLMGCYRFDATLLSILGAISAASTFWLVVPESFSFGSVTILLGLIFVVLTQYRQFSFIWYVGLNVLTVSITITNSMVGIFTTVVNQRWKRIIQIGIVSLLVATGLWILQRILFTNSGFPFQPGTFIGEKKFMSAPDQSGVLAAIGSFFYQTMVMPATQLIESPIRPDWIKLETQPLNPASGGWLGAVAVYAWTALLVLGVWGFFSIKKHHKLRLVLGLTLLAQIAMHSVYGAEETFIYSLHFAPLLLTLTAFSLLTRVRLLSLALAIILIISAGVTNRAQFQSITSELWNYGTPQQQVDAQMSLRPSDPWLRSAGHVILAAPGSPITEKAFHEPGGSFSPKPGSFGISIWALDREGNITATSDSIPLDEIQQQFINTPNQGIPGIVTKTAYYQSSWSALPKGWKLSLNRVVSSDTNLALVIRSVGPAGGAVRSLDWDGQRLLINDRWVVKNLPSQTNLYLGDERSPDWIHQRSTASQWQDDYGWGYARLELGNINNFEIEVEDLTPVPMPSLTMAATESQPLFSLPDAQFIDSFNAQIAHLLMGLVGNQTRPADPIDYPLPRFREGAYTVVALARTGHLETARQLLPYFATTDFVNGTQPEAEIPALGVWALTAVAQQVNQPAYDQSLWPDVYRKVELIVDLLSSHRPGYPIAGGANRPFSENPDYIRLDLGAGKMDASPGLIALDPAANLMSYRALLDGAALADRINQPDIAARWRSHATQLQTAWQQAFDLKFANLDATYTTGLWPSWLAIANQDAFVNGLENRWQAAYDNTGSLRQVPENTSFSIAETHQWLYLNQPARVWSTLKWFWENQASPGLYTWWGSRNDVAGSQTPGSLSHWNRFRGWINPPHVTPHYWSAAEMLLLQLDMLAYVNPATSSPTLVIGAGIPSDWLSQPLSVKRLYVGGNVIDWEWDGQQMNVQIQGKTMDVQLGEGFPEKAPVTVVAVSETG